MSVVITYSLCVNLSDVKTRVLHKLDKLDKAEVVGVHGRQIPQGQSTL